MITTVLDLLKMAKSVFEKRGGAVGSDLDSQGRICATHAVTLVANNNVIVPWWGALDILDETAIELFGDHIVGRKNEGVTRPLAQINDKLGTKAVMDIYELAIKKAEDQQK